MRILLANKFYYRRGGDCIYMLNLEQLLKEHGHEVAVFAMDYPDNLETLWQRYFPSNMSKLKAFTRPFGDGETKRKFMRLIDDFKPDVVHLNNIHTQLSLVCIVDTDKKYPTDTPKEDSTYSLCAAIPQNQIYHFMALEVHEVENLIPLNYIDNLPWSQYNSADRVNKKHFDYLRNDANHILPYYDYKSGIRKNQELLSSQEYMAFAEECFNLDEELTNQYHSFSAYVSTKNNKDELLYKLFSGSFLITHTLEMIKGHSQPTEPELLPFQEHNWNMIGSTLLNWCIAESKDAMI